MRQGKLSLLSLLGSFSHTRVYDGLIMEGVFITFLFRPGPINTTPSVPPPMAPNTQSMARQGILFKVNG